MSRVSIRDLDLNYGSERVLQKLNLEVEPGEFLVLLGASGCGKSTLLNCIAGLLDVSGGQIHIDTRNVTWEEPKDRGIAMVFQSYALYPQMTVEGNLSFGLRNARIPRSEIRERVDRAARLLHIEALLKRKPAQLSGGQRQRVAIGRALVRDVDVFLFDEPLSNLDAKLRAELRVEIKRLHGKLTRNTMIYVTHDQIEAMTLADRIAIMREGVILQLGDPHTIYAEPVNRYVAEFIGSPRINLLSGELTMDGEPDGGPVFVSGNLRVDLSRYAFRQKPEPGRVLLGVRPEAVQTGPAARSEPYSGETAIDVVEPMGADTLVWSSLCAQEFRYRMPGLSALHPGDRVPIGFDPRRCSVFQYRSELRL